MSNSRDATVATVIEAGLGVTAVCGTTLRPLFEKLTTTVRSRCSTGYDPSQILDSTGKTKLTGPSTNRTASSQPWDEVDFITTVVVHGKVDSRDKPMESDEEAYEFSWMNV